MDPEIVGSFVRTCAWMDGIERSRAWVYGCWGAWKIASTGPRNKRARKRERLAAMIADCEQVIITAAVPEDVPSQLVGRTYAVTLGSVTERA